MHRELTVLIPCKNERENIPACIAAVRSIADEVVVADSGSSDGTVVVAQRMGCRVIEREYIDSGNFKNWAIPQAAHAWILIVDADERITPELATEIRNLLDKEPDKDAYAIGRHNYFLGHAINHGDWAHDRVIRLVRRDRCRYAEHTDHAEFDLPPERVGLLRHKMIHYTAWNLDDYLAKMTHYASQTADHWHATGVQPNIWNLVFNAPLRFLRAYLMRGGFLDGKIGFQVAGLTACYSFLKQVQLWQRTYSLSRVEVDHHDAADEVVEVLDGFNRVPGARSEAA